MATAILHSIKQGAYIAIALYVVFIAVVTITSMNPQFKDPAFRLTGGTLVELPSSADARAQRAS
jgi:hypothetical protein